MDLEDDIGKDASMLNQSNMSMRSSRAQLAQKVYEDGDITSNKVVDLTNQHIDKADIEEAAKILIVRQSLQV